MTEKFDPYAVLGVKPDASLEQIEDAFRVAAAKAHPDRPGGSTEAMTDVNMARKILTDPLMRRAYDETGATQAEKPLDLKARDLLLRLAGTVIRNSTPYDDLVLILRLGLEKQRAGCREARSKTLEDLSNLKIRASRLKGPPDNFLAGLLQSEIERGEAHLPVFDADEMTIARALDLLKEYSYGPTTLAGPVIPDAMVESPFARFLGLGGKAPN